MSTIHSLRLASTEDLWVINDNSIAKKFPQTLKMREVELEVDKVTSKRREIHKIISEHNGIGYEKIGEEVGLKGNTVNEHCKILEKLGFVSVFEDDNTHLVFMKEKLPTETRVNRGKAETFEGGVPLKKFKQYPVYGVRIRKGRKKKTEDSVRCLVTLHLSGKWTPMKALGRAQKQIDDLTVPALGKEITQDYQLNFSNLMNEDNRKLEEYLTAYGGYKAYLETQLSDISSKKNALEAAFDEGYATAIFRLAEEREEEGKKKLTREEVRGAAMSKYEQLRELRREVIEQEIVHTRVVGLLSAYKAAYDAVSRIVTLRTYGNDNIKH